MILTIIGFLGAEMADQSTAGSRLIISMGANEATSDAEVGEPSSGGLVDFQHYPATAATTVGQDKTTIINDHASKEFLYRFVDIQFLGFDWILLTSWANETGETHKYTQRVKEGLVVSCGKTIEQFFGIRAAFEGLEFQLAESYKTFSNNETSEGVEGQPSIDIAPNATTFLYRKRYRFKTTVWFVSEFGGKIFLVWSPGNEDPLTKTVEADIDSAEFRTLTRSLSGSQIISATPSEGLTTQSDFLAKPLGNVGPGAQVVLGGIMG